MKTNNSHSLSSFNYYGIYEQPDQGQMLQYIVNKFQYSENIKLKEFSIQYLDKKVTKPETVLFDFLKLVDEATLTLGPNRNQSNRKLQTSKQKLERLLFSITTIYQHQVLSMNFLKKCIIDSERNKGFGQIDMRTLLNIVQSFESIGYSFNNKINWNY